MEKYDLSKVMFNVFSLPFEVKILERFPRLAFYPEFNEPVAIDRNKIIRYIIAVYDRNGLALYEPNMPKRKNIAADIAGFVRDKEGNHKKQIKEIMDGNDPVVNAMIIRYVKLHRSPKYAALVGMIEAFYKILAKMVAGEDLSTADVKTFREFELEIQERSSDIFGGDKSGELIRQLQEDVELEKIELRPEDIAKRIKAGLPVVDINPYDGWVPSKMRLVARKETEDKEGDY